MYHVYILRSLKHRFCYVGATKDMQKRLREHNSGRSKATRPYRPLVLVHVESFPTLAQARKREWQLKCTPAGGKEKRRLVGGG